MDAAPEPASGASGLPVGLYAPYKSADNNFTSQITDIGVGFTYQLTKRLLIEGLDWQPSGVMTRKSGELKGIEHWEAHAGWIKPAALVKACLSHPNITWRGNFKVSKLVKEGEFWTLLDTCQKKIDHANWVVIAASNQSAELLNTVSGIPLRTPKCTPIRTPTLNFQAVRGQVTYGDLQHPYTPNHPINGGGSYIETNSEWLVGASYDRDNLSLKANRCDQVENFERLEKLVPDIATQLKPDFERGRVKDWVGVRCATTDRLPVVGEIMPGLWLCTAMASRGLTFAPLCAEVLASQILNEKIPLNPRLVQALSVQRYMKK